MVKLTVLLENTSSDPKLESEHGLSILIETPKSKFIFDCGQSEMTWRNFARLGADLSTVAFVVLSHSHYDHAGGYPSMPIKPPILYTGKNFWREKFSIADDGIKYRGAGFDRNDLDGWGVRQKVCNARLDIAEGMWLIGSFNRKYPFETIPTKFVCGDEHQPDDFSDEICLAIRGRRGLTVVVGCSHVGILNIVSTVKSRLNYPVVEVIGGIHLSGADRDRIDVTLNELKSLGVERLNLCHCSGRSDVSTGSKIFIGD